MDWALGGDVVVKGAISFLSKASTSCATDSLETTWRVRGSLTVPYLILLIVSFSFSAMSEVLRSCVVRTRSSHTTSAGLISPLAQLDIDLLARVELV